jgi:S1-C subfamily serine protease
MPALQGLISALSALLITLNALYSHSASTTPPVTGIFGPTATSAPAVTPSTLPAAVRPSLPAIAPAVSVANPPLPKAATPDLAVAMANLRSALVNIICISKEPGVRSASGSGVIFDSRGLILTNSHVAQYFLLESTLPEGRVECSVRSGSPAQTAYEAKLAYMSSQWLAANPRTLTVSAARGTGEHDFAVLVITKSATPLPLPALYPFVPLAQSTPALQQAVAVGGYAAQELTSAQVRNSLYPTLAFSTIKKHFSFDGENPDVLAISGSAVAQEGSSGGGVVNAKGELIGVITTSTQTGSYESRELRAVTLGHVRRSFKVDSSEDFDSYFKRTSISSMVSVFTDDVRDQGEFLLKAIGI